MANKVFGIDLGTTYSCIAYVDQYGQPAVVNNMDGNPTTPSVVMFNEDGTYVAGQMAKNMSGLYHDRVVSLVKREMGHPDWTFSVDGQEFSAPSVSSKILETLVEDARVATGEDVTDVVITVPAYFGQAEREATRAAGTIAGLNVVDIINEPTAAAFAYGFGRGAGTEETVLVYDLGGGTFDITVISLEGGNIRVVATDGDHELGGADWDDVLVKLVVRRFMEENPDADNPEYDPVTLAEIRSAVEDGKRALSTMPAAQIKIQSGAHLAMIKVTREDFEAETRELLAQTFTKVHEVVREAAELGSPKIDRLLLVGGSSIMPAVATCLSAELGMEPELADPHMAVAKGAALWGQKAEITAIVIDQLRQQGVEVEDGDLGNVDLEVIEQVADAVAAEAGLRREATVTLATTQASNVCSQGFGVRVVDGATGTEYIAFLIHRNAQLPVATQETFFTVRDDQSVVEIVVYEQNTAEESDVPDHNTVVIQGEIGPLPGGYPQGTDVTITFDMDGSGKLLVTAAHPGQALPLTLEQQTGSVITAEVVEESRQQMSAIVRQR